MKKALIGLLLVGLAVTSVQPAKAAFVIGGENGWQLSTDGIVDVFATYATTTPKPSGSRSLSLLSIGGTENTQDTGKLGQHHQRIDEAERRAGIVDDGLNRCG